jgi:IS5 family transposase
MSPGRINIIDATTIEAAQSGLGNGVDDKPTHDCDAGWHVKNDIRGDKKTIYGFLVYTDLKEEGIILLQSLTARKIHHSYESDKLLLGDDDARHHGAAYRTEEAHKLFLSTPLV